MGWALEPSLRPNDLGRTLSSVGQSDASAWQSDDSVSGKAYTIEQVTS